MYCADCKAAGRDAPAPFKGGSGADRFGSLQCQGCGVLLSPDTPIMALRRKLLQLARFGLADPAHGAGGD
jgi:hypothetical protein